jgi:Fic family protein
MDWNLQHPDWPHFRYRPDLLAGRAAEFLRGSGVVAGAALHLADDERLGLSIELMASEALKTSEIVGEILDRDSVQSSLRRHFGLQTDGRRIGAAEQGVAAMLTSGRSRLRAGRSTSMVGSTGSQTGCWRRSAARSHPSNSS